MTMNWDNIKYLFQIPLEWFKAISNKVFRAYGTNFIRVRNGEEGAMNIDVDPDTFAQAVMNVTGGGSGGGTVKSVDNIAPDANGNVPLGAIRSINENVYPDANGNVDLGLGVASVNGIMPDQDGDVDLGAIVNTVNGIPPDVNGNVEVGTVRTVNGIVPVGGNVNLGTLITGVDGVTSQDFGMLHLNAVRTVNNISVDNNFNVDVGTVTSINGVEPDSDGNVALRVVATIDGNWPDDNGNIDLTDYVKTVNSISPDSNGNVQIATGVSSVNDIAPEDGNVDLGKIVNSVNDIEPDSTGNVELNCVESVNGITPIDGDVDLGDLVYSVNGTAPDANGNVALDYVESVDGLLPYDGDIMFPIVANEWLKADSQGHIASTSDKPVVLSSTNEGYMYAHNGQLQFKNEEYVTLSTDQTITGKKNFNNIQLFSLSSNQDNKTIIDGSTVTLKTSSTGFLPLVIMSNGDLTNDAALISRGQYGLQVQDTYGVGARADRIIFEAPAGNAGWIRLSSDQSTMIYSGFALVNGRTGVQLSSAANLATLANSPNELATDTAIATVGYVKNVALSGLSGEYVTIGTDQNVNGVKTFTREMNLKINTDRDSNSRADTSRNVTFIDNANLPFARVGAHAYSNGTNEMTMSMNKYGTNDAWIRMQVANEGNIHYKADTHVIRASNNLADGNMQITPRDGRIEIFPNSARGWGGYIDFHVAGETTSDYTSRIIDYADYLLFKVAGASTRRMLLEASANNVQLVNAPTIPRADKTSKAVATCGWVNTNVDAALNNLNLSQYAKTTDLTGYVTLNTNQTITGIKTWQAAGRTDSTQIRPGQVIANFFSVLNNDSVWGGLRYLNSVGMEVFAFGGLVLNAYTNGAKLENPPNEYADDNCIATVGFVKNNGKVKTVDGVEPDSNGNVDFGLAADSIVMTDGEGHLTTASSGVSTTKKVITGVSWNGTQLVISSETWTYQNGLLTSATANANETINTVTYN